MVKVCGKVNIGWLARLAAPVTSVEGIEVAGALIRMGWLGPGINWMGPALGGGSGGPGPSRLAGMGGALEIWVGVGGGPRAMVMGMGVTAGGGGAGAIGCTGFGVLEPEVVGGVIFLGFGAGGGPVPLSSPLLT